MPCKCGDSVCSCGIPCYCTGSCDCSNCADTLLRHCRLCDKLKDRFGSVERNECSCFLRDSQISKTKLVIDEFHQNWKNAVFDGSDTSIVPIRNANPRVNENTTNESYILPTDHGMNNLYLHANLENGGYHYAENGFVINGVVFYNLPEIYYQASNYKSESCTFYNLFNFGYEMNSTNLDWDCNAGYLTSGIVSDDSFYSNEDNRPTDWERSQSMFAGGRGNWNNYVDYEEMDTRSTSSNSHVYNVVQADYTSDPDPRARQNNCDVENERLCHVTPEEISSESVVGRIYSSLDEAMAMRNMVLTSLTEGNLRNSSAPEFFQYSSDFFSNRWENRYSPNVDLEEMNTSSTSSLSDPNAFATVLADYASDSELRERRKKCDNQRSTLCHTTPGEMTSSESVVGRIYSSLDEAIAAQNQMLASRTERNEQYSCSNISETLIGAEEKEPFIADLNGQIKNLKCNDDAESNPVALSESMSQNHEQTLNFSELHASETPSTEGTSNTYPERGPSR